MQIQSYEEWELKEKLPPRYEDSNKGDYGKLLLAAGSRNMCGAAYLAGLAVGYWPDQETVKQNGAIDRTFEPELSKEERDEKMNGWHKAVRYAEGWAK